MFLNPLFPVGYLCFFLFHRLLCHALGGGAPDSAFSIFLFSSIRKRRLSFCLAFFIRHFSSSPSQFCEGALHTPIWESRGTPSSLLLLASDRCSGSSFPLLALRIFASQLIRSDFKSCVRNRTISLALSEGSPFFVFLPSFPFPSVPRLWSSQRHVLIWAAKPLSVRADFSPLCWSSDKPDLGFRLL